VSRVALPRRQRSYHFVQGLGCGLTAMGATPAGAVSSVYV
jgi:hypothetical protein